VTRTLLDASPLVAICNDKEVRVHGLCVNIFETVGTNYVTTLPCLTEAMYLLHRILGWRGQNKLWELLSVNRPDIHPLTIDEMRRMRILMDKYQDTPMDFADASLVVAGETLRTNRIFTLDSDFHIYRINNSESFEIIP
jgi:uncharacterized protein